MVLVTIREKIEKNTLCGRALVWDTAKIEKHIPGQNIETAFVAGLWLESGQK